MLFSLVACSDGVRVDSQASGGTTSADGADTGDFDGGDVAGGGGTDGDGSDADGGTGALPELAVHDAGFTGTYYSGAEQCASCHDDLPDASGNLVSMASDWSSSMMANSARDPYWMAKVAAEARRNPHLQDSLGDTCSRCHAPMANDTARKDGLTPSLGDGGLLDEDNPLFDHAMDGVSCTLCHQIDDDAVLGTPQGHSGNFNVLVQANPAERPAYGPYSDPNGVLMQSQVRFNPVFGAHMSDSAVCASCHDLVTPAGGHQAGAAVTFFPEQMVFSEWRNSVYASEGDSGRTCQACHMPVVPGEMLLANRGGGVPREGVSRHTFLGANTVMQSMLMTHRESLGIAVPAARFAESIERNRAFLQEAGEVEITDSSISGGILETHLVIRNQTGHKLPSGFPSRRVHVHFLVLNEAGDAVFESGALNDDGSIDGLVSDADSSQYELHHDLIDSPDQVQVYEAIMGDSAEQVTHTLMQATRYVKDNRLLPSGFDKASAPDDIMTVGQANTDDNFQAGGDEIVYRVVLPADGEYTVIAELVYQPLAFGHIQDLFEDADLDAVDRFRTLFDATELKAEVIDSATITVRQVQ
ncbi:hypothetical protein ACUNV4_06985 [Granulosicoccus sp. 3-233]|uniref:hypothetical protein n=1 Tax=Granulosicoccus sp. 3-233 TaxID=3417969 RepID=UPI003D35789B